MWYCVILQYVLKLWGSELNTRPEEEKRSYRGKIASATFSQTVTYLKPLFRNLKKNVSHFLVSLF